MREPQLQNQAYLHLRTENLVEQLPELGSLILHIFKMGISRDSFIIRPQLIPIFKYKNTLGA